MWNCIFKLFPQFKNWFLANFEIGIWPKKFFMKLIYLISRVFLAWSFFNFLAHCVLAGCCVVFLASLMRRSLNNIVWRSSKDYDQIWFSNDVFFYRRGQIFTVCVNFTVSWLIINCHTKNNNQKKTMGRPICNFNPVFHENWMEIEWKLSTNWMEIEKKSLM